MLQVLRALALWSPPPPRVVSLGRDSWSVPAVHRPLASAEQRALLRDRAARAVTRLLALFARWQAGTLPRPRFDFPRPRPAASVTPRSRRPHERRPHPRLPRTRAWAVTHAPELPAFASQLSFLLARPEMAPFLAACPQAGRLLRPLCHAIGAELPPMLALPRRPRLRRPHTARPPRARRLKLTDPSLKLQPYVIRAVRYIRRKYGRDG